MAKDPAFLFYSDNFHSGTQFFTNEQTGKYIRLLCAQHQHGHLSDKKMLMICGEKDAEIWAKFKQDENGNFYNERLELEVQKRQNYTESRRKNLSKPVNKKPKQQKKKKQEHHMADHMEEHMQSHMGNGNGIGNEDKKGDENVKSLHVKMREKFVEVYQLKKGLPFSWDAISGKHLNQVIGRIKKFIPEKTDEAVFDFWKTMLEHLPDWYLSNGFSPAVINSKFSEINSCDYLVNLCFLF